MAKYVVGSTGGMEDIIFYDIAQCGHWAAGNIAKWKVFYVWKKSRGIGARSLETIGESWPLIVMHDGTTAKQEED